MLWGYQQFPHRAGGLGAFALGFLRRLRRCCKRVSAQPRRHWTPRRAAMACGNRFSLHHGFGALYLASRTNTTRCAERTLLKFKTHCQEIKKAVLTEKSLAMFARFSADVPPIVSVLKAETAKNVRKMRFFSENSAPNPQKNAFFV